MMWQPSDRTKFLINSSVIISKIETLLAERANSTHMRVQLAHRERYKDV